MRAHQPISKGESASAVSTRRNANLPEVIPLSGTATHNDRIPTDPHTALILALAVLCAAGQLTTDQAAALAATGGIAELALCFFRLLNRRR